MILSVGRWPLHSPLGHVALHARSTGHLILKRAELLRVVATASAKVRLRRRFILGDGLLAEARSRVVRLVLVELLGQGLARGGLRERPAWEVLLCRRVRRELRGIPAGADGRGRCRVVLEATATAETERIECGALQLRLVLRVVLRAWVLLEIVRLHLFAQDKLDSDIGYRKNECTYARLGADFRSARPALPVEVSLDRVVQEQGVLIEVILRLLRCHLHCVREGLARRLGILDLVIVGVLRAGGVLTNVLSLRQLAIELFAAIPAVGLREAELSLRFFNGQRELAE